MSSEAMTALAAAGGTAVVQAAGTDAWTDSASGRQAGSARGNPQREHAELERLDQAASELEAAAAAGPTEAQRERIRQEARWQARIEALLESSTTQNAPGLPSSWACCWPSTPSGVPSLSSPLLRGNDWSKSATTWPTGSRSEKGRLAR